MLVNEYISDFNSTVSDMKFLSYTDELVLNNKLNTILSQFESGNFPQNVSDFFTNLHHLLSQTSGTKSEFLETCLDVILTCLKTKVLKIREATSCEFPMFFPILLSNLNLLGHDDEHKLLKILTIIRELLTFNCEMDEHHLKMIVESLRDLINHQNEDVKTLCLHILVKLCLDNPPAKYLITRNLKASKVKDRIVKTAENLLSFAFFMILEEETLSKDVQYFLFVSLKSLRENLINLKTDNVRLSLDILRYIQQVPIQLDFCPSADERIVKVVSDLIDALNEKLTENSEDIQGFFDGIFMIFSGLIVLDHKLIHALEQFVETAFVSAKVSRTAPALKFLTTFIEHDGVLRSSEVVVEGLVEHFTDGDNLDHQQKNSFFILLDALAAKDKLSEVHLNRISNFFQSYLDAFKSRTLMSMDDSEIFTFIYFVFSLSRISKYRAVFFVKFKEILKLDFLPMVIVKGHLSRNEEILTMLFQLSSVEDFPNKKIAQILATSGSRGSFPSLTKSFERQAMQSNNMSSNENLDLLIERINSKIDSNEIHVHTADMLQVYRSKMTQISRQLTSMSKSLEQNSVKFSKLQREYASSIESSEKQEFVAWCLQVDKDRAKVELKKLTTDNEGLKKTVSDFQVKLDEHDAYKKETRNQMKLKIKEMAKLVEAKEQAEQKLHDAKAKLAFVQQQNDTRINELKENLETATQKHEEAIAEAIEEQKKLAQKLSVSEKENQKLQETIKFNQRELVKAQEKNQQYEVELREMELMKNTVMSLMQSKSSKKLN